MFPQRSKLFRFHGEWEEICLGHANLLLCRVSGKLRFLMTDEKTAQLVGNIEVVDHTLTTDHSECAWVWRATLGEALPLMFASKATTQGSREAFGGGQVLEKGIRGTASPRQFLNTGHHPESPA